jgi:hypothetical protein
MSVGSMNEGREDFAVPITCRGCGQVGSIVWQENAGLNEKGPMRTLVLISSGFHKADGATNSGDPKIICDHCGTAQTD